MTQKAKSKKQCLSLIKHRLDSGIRFASVRFPLSVSILSFIFITVYLNRHRSFNQFSIPGLRPIRSSLNGGYFGDGYSLWNVSSSPRDCKTIFLNDAKVLSLSFKSNETTNILLDRRSKVMVEGWIQMNPGEKQVNAVFEELLFPQCSNSLLFLDIGANVGYYGIKAGKFGCRAFLFDPQPGCIEIIEANLCLNFPADNTISSVPFGLAQNANQIMVPSSGCSGTYSLVHDAYTKPKEDVPSQLLDLSILKHMPKMSLMIKIDTEGNEIDLLSGMINLVHQHKVREIMVEVTPTFWDSMGLSRHSAVQVFTQYLQYCMIYEPKRYKTSSFVGFTEATLETLLTDPKLVQTDLWISCSE